MTKGSKRQDDKIEVRMTAEEKEVIRQRADEFGFRNLSEFIRVMALKGKLTL